jgi:hypothetical protein
MNMPYSGGVQLVLRTVDIRKIKRWRGGEPLEAVSAQSWYEHEQEQRELGDWDEGDEGDWQGLEDALRRGDSVPPIVLQETPGGELIFVDGWHRISIALHIGRYELLAYVAQPSDSWY